MLIGGIQLPKCCSSKRSLDEDLSAVVRRAKSEATSSFWLAPIPASREACHHCARAIALVAGRAFALPVGSCGYLPKSKRPPARNAAGLHLNEGSIPHRYHSSARDALLPRCLAGAAFGFQSLEVGAERVLSRFAFANCLLGIPAAVLRLRCTLFGCRRRLLSLFKRMHSYQRAKPIRVPGGTALTSRFLRPCASGWFSQTHPTPKHRTFLVDHE
jgi:hypothetical protein